MAVTSIAIGDANGEMLEAGTPGRSLALVDAFRSFSDVLISEFGLKNPDMFVITSEVKDLLFLSDCVLNPAPEAVASVVLGAGLLSRHFHVQYNLQ